MYSKPPLFKAFYQAEITMGKEKWQIVLIW